MEKKIELGDTVEDIHTGFKGVALHRILFFNGCVQFGVMPRVGKDNKPVLEEAVEIDEISLKIVKKFKKVEKKSVVKKVARKPTGGAYHKGRKMRGY